MSTNLSTEVKSVSDIISDKIKAEFVNLIPDEKWKELVLKEIEEFTSKRKERYSDVIKPSYFERMVQDTMRELLNEKIKEKLKTIPSFISDDTVLEGLILKITNEAGKGFMESVTKDIANRVLNSIRNND